MYHRILVAAASLALVASIAPSTAAAGTIHTAGATIESGAAPTQGTVTIDPAAPTGVVPTLPVIDGPGAPPTVTGSMPAMPSFGDGGDGAFSATSGTVALTPGTHQFTSFDVSNGASVTVSGPTTILVRNAVSISGSVSSTTAGAGITIHCGGDFTLVSRTPASRVQTTGASSPIEIVAGGKVEIGTGVNNADAQVSASSSDVRLDTYDDDAEGVAISIESGRILAPAGSITVRSVGWFSCGGILSTRPGVVACQGPLWIRSFASNITANSNGSFSATAASATMECVGRLFFGGPFEVGGTGSATFRTTNGPFEVSEHVTTADGDITVECGGTADIHGDEVTAGGSGGVSITCGGDVRARRGSVSSTANDVDLLSGGTISLQSNMSFGSDTALRLSSSGGDFRMFDSSALVGAGAATVRVAGDVFIGEPTPPEKLPSGEANCVVDVGSLDLAAGGEVILDATTTRAGGIDGEFRVLSGDALIVAGAISARGDVTLESRDGDVDVAGVTVTTEDMTEGGAIHVETWKAGGLIDASTATIRSGASASRSGDVDVLVHDPASGPGPVIESFILPKTVKARINDARPEKSRIVAAGFFDLGPDPLDLSQAANIDVGDAHFDVAGFASNRAGTKFKHKEAGLLVVITPNRKGSSRARFRLVAKGEALRDAVETEGAVNLSFKFGQITGDGTVKLTRGVYKLGRRRGALVAPNLWPSRVKAKLAGAGKDKLKLILGLATDGATPATAPDLHLEFGSAWSLDVPGTEFVRQGDRYRADGVVLDFLRETLTVKVKSVSLGDGFVEGPQPLSLKVGLGTDTREVHVRMVRKGKRFVY